MMELFADKCWHEIWFITDKIMFDSIIIYIFVLKYMLFS